MVSVVETGKVMGIRHFCHFWKHEAMGAVVEGWNVIIFCHFCKNQAIISSANSSEIVVRWLGWLAGWLAGLATSI